MEQSVVVGLITFLLGLFLGHRLSLGRDKRKEFNDIAQPIRETLLKEGKGPSPHFAGLGEIDADKLESVLPWWQRNSFRCTLNDYYKEKERSVTQDPTYGSVSYAKTDEIIRHIEHLLHYVERK